MKTLNTDQKHSASWIFQTWAAIILSMCATGVGLVFLPMDGWSRGYMAVSVVFTVSSTINVSTTSRDLHESKRISARVDEGRVEKLLSEHHPLE